MFERYGGFEIHGSKGFNCKDAFGHNYRECHCKCVRFQTFMTYFMICVSIRSDRESAGV